MPTDLFFHQIKAGTSSRISTRLKAIESGSLLGQMESHLLGKLLDICNPESAEILFSILATAIR